MDKKVDVIDQDSYKSGYTAGALESYAMCRNQFTKNIEREYRRTLYFLKQKLYGILLIAVAILSAIVLDGDMTIGLLTVPLGLIMIFSRKLILVNDFYWEEKERRKRSKPVCR